MTTTIQRGMGRIQFLANIESIQKGIDEGWPMNAVFAQHQDKLDITYSQFARYVKKYIKEADRTTPGVIITKPTASKPTSPVVEEELSSKLEKLNDPLPLSDEELF